MSLDGFDRVVRGTLILRWSPSAELEKFVVLRPNVPYVSTTGARTTINSHAIDKLHEDGSMGVDGGDTQVTPGIVEEEEAFGYTYIFTSGETFKLPEWIP